jgi:serine/threonine protein kinase
MDDQNRHSAYYRVLGEHSRMAEYILAPEQLTALQKMNYEPRYSHSKADLFAVGMVMLELITLDSARFYFNDQKMEVMLNKALFSLDIHSAKYSKPLLDAIRSCLASDPAERPEPEEVLCCLEELRNSGKGSIFCIRL